MTANPHLPLTLAGAPGSPYTRKMLAVLRYRRLPYRLLVGQDHRARMPQAKVPLLPTFYLPDDASEKGEAAKKLLRTHTSPVQIRTMMNQAWVPPRKSQPSSRLSTKKRAMT